MVFRKTALIAFTLTLLMANKDVFSASLPPCPDSPNCVSTRSDKANRVEPFQLNTPFDQNWPLLIDEIRKIERIDIVLSNDTQLHAEATSAVFRFVDDLHLFLDRSSGRIDIRSASRVGYYDFGVNRRRVESIRDTLKAKRLIR